MQKKHAFQNIKKVNSISEPYFDEALDAGAVGLVFTAHPGGRLVSRDGERECVNMSSYSYLGLDEHPEIVRAAAEYTRDVGVVNSSVSRALMTLPILEDAESRLSDLFGADVGTVNSCAAGAWAMLPLLASGVLTGGEAPLMAFDRYAHFCMNAMKSACADETDVVTIGHNDMEALEELCRRNKVVAYVADSVYSSSGNSAPFAELLELQRRYGLFLFLDDAHGTSVVGRNGRGYALESMGEMNDRTVIITSLNKGFGASGGAILFGPRGDKSVRRIMRRLGGPFMWSQRINTAGLGAIIASTNFHRGPELVIRQRELQSNIRLFDKLHKSPGAGSDIPIRFIPMPSESVTISVSAHLLDQGYFVEPNFFPIVKRGGAGLRVRLRATMAEADIVNFCSLLASVRDAQDVVSLDRPAARTEA